MTSTSTISTNEVGKPVSRETLERLVRDQRAAFRKEGTPSAEVRINRIDRLLLAIVEHIDEIAESLNAEYGSRPTALTKALDTLPFVGAAQELRDGIAEWMKPQDVSGGYVVPQPLGVVGVIGAWNFPLELTIHPAIDALAAGNRVIIKFPDFHPRTGAVLAAAVAERLSPDEVAVVVGDISTAEHFSQLQLDHIVFTGSPAIGKKVAEAAARNLVPTTLELGGKNPVVVSESADLDLAAHRIAGSRLLNSGQVCLCPDYVFVPQKDEEVFVQKLGSEIRALFPDPSSTAGLVSIVNQRNYARIEGLVDDAVEKGAERVAIPGESDQQGEPSGDRLLTPTILRNVPADAAISTEEVFGPVISIYSYAHVDEAIDYINSHPSPLGAYWYGEQDAQFDRFLEFTRSGGITVNDGIAHAFLPGTPFGGVGNSGSGAYHGRAGFDRLSHMRTVAVAEGELGLTDGLVGASLATEGFAQAIDANIQAALDDLKARVRE
ncbi:aldehyde dehydrogenase family protein [Rhodococcoides fascians A25f]|uniref:aldehyde dehydrogenase family protein n=1 Tax=Rhodococcoides fascians TaxID=1828 RepID=UPI0009B92524|nr:aldehyde dehydrogenase family protein [Rhodococcus fascians]QII07852.1 aldehyde dehydrogenase family protein [Rhodococcus fascians A25f]